MKRKFILNRIIKVMLLVLSMTVGQNVLADNNWNITPSVDGNVVTFTITRINTSVAETVNYRLVNLSAFAGQHYNVTKVNGVNSNELSGQFTFTAGDETSRTVTVTEKTASTDAYKYQTGTNRSYKLEITDIEGFYLADNTRSFTTGTQFTGSYVNQSITDLVYFQSGSVKSGSGNKYLDVAHSGTNNSEKMIDDGYDYDNSTLCTVSTDNLFNSNNDLRTRLNGLGYRMYATVYFQQREVDDGYQYIQILADNASTYDGKDGDGKIDNGPSTSLYKAAFILTKTENVCTSWKYQAFPHRTDDHTSSTEFDYSDSYLYAQKFKSATPSYRATTSGSLVLTPTVSNINVRFDSNGSGEDTWYLKNLKVRLALVDETAPTCMVISVAPGHHAKGNKVYVSVAFNEIVTSSDAKLTTSWGTLSLENGTSGSNVLSFSGTIDPSASGTLEITGKSGTISDLAGNEFSGSLNQDLSTSLDASRVYTISYDLDGGTVKNPTKYSWETSSITLKEPSKFGYYFEGWTGSNGNVPNRNVTIPQGSRSGNLEFTANWTDLWGIDNGANGTSEHPYCITTTRGLDYLASHVNDGNSCSDIYFVLGDDISYSYDKNWNNISNNENNYTRIGNTDHGFGGDFNGQNHSITGVRIYKGGENSNDHGLFGRINYNGSVRNVILDNARITGYDAIGGIVGSNYGIIENCIVKNTAIHSVRNNAYKHGGIAGYNQKTILRCTSSAILTIDNGVEGSYCYGGIAGESYLGVIRNCFVKGVTIPSVDTKGAIVGHNQNNTLENNYYYNCTVGGNNTNIGISSGDVLANNGAVRVYAMTHPAGITATRTDGTILSGSNKVYTDGVTYDNKEYYTNSSAVTLGSANAGLTLVNVTYNGNDAADNGNGTWSFTMPNAATTVSSGYAVSESYGITGQVASLIAGKEVQFTRTFTADKASTICLPFPMTSVDGGNVYTFTGIDFDDVEDEWVATMTDATPNGSSITTTVTNTPYLFMPAATGEVTFSGTVGNVPANIEAGSTVSTDTYWTFYGTYSRADYGTAPMTGYVYGFASRDKTVDGHDIVAGQFVKAKSGAYVPPFRAYLIYTGSDNTFRAPSRDGNSGGPELPDRIKVRLLSSSGTVTAVGTLDAVTGDVTIERWFDLSGRPVEGVPSEPGLYLNNRGKKIMIK